MGGFRPHPTKSPEDVQDSPGSEEGQALPAQGREGVHGAFGKDQPGLDSQEKELRRELRKHL